MPLADEFPPALARRAHLRSDLPRRGAVGCAQALAPFGHVASVVRPQRAYVTPRALKTEEIRPPAGCTPSAILC